MAGGGGGGGLGRGGGGSAGGRTWAWRHRVEQRAGGVWIGEAGAL
jgi:hypothetical protein